MSLPTERAPARDSDAGAPFDRDGFDPDTENRANERGDLETDVNNVEPDRDGVSRRADPASDVEEEELAYEDITEIVDDEEDA